MTYIVEGQARPDCARRTGQRISRVSQSNSSLEHALLHLSLLGGADLQVSKFLLCMIHPDRRMCVVRYSTLRDALAWVHRHQSLGFGAYVLVNENDGTRHRTRDRIVAVRSIWCDLDGIDIDNIKFALSPSLIISSGSLKSYHVYWLTNPTYNLDLNTADQINKDMVLRYGSDPGACDRSRLLRLAGTLNTKPGVDQYCRIIGGNGERYCGDDIRKAFLSLQPVPKPMAIRQTWLLPKNKPAGWITDEVRIESALAAIDPDVDCNIWIAIGAALHKHYRGGDVGLRLWEAWSRTGIKHKLRRTSNGVVSECVIRWCSFKNTRASIATLFYHAKAAGWQDPRVPGCTKKR